MQTISINFQVPQGWHELDDKQLRYVYSLIAREFSADEIKTLALLHFSGCKVIARHDKKTFLLKHGKNVFQTSGVPFETYIVVENLYQGFLSTQKDALLDEIAHVLYPGCSASLTPEERVSIFYWVASLKDMFARRFPDFFQPASANAENLLGSSQNIGKQLQESMDAQIRALTKGDITKEREILSLDTWRALTELNAQAKEYKQINAQINAKK